MWIRQHPTTFLSVGCEEEADQLVHSATSLSTKALGMMFVVADNNILAMRVDV